jgi:hypothetical protein
MLQGSICEQNTPPSPLKPKSQVQLDADVLPALLLLFAAHGAHSKLYERT